jgi:hypothetical protein
MSFYPVFKEQVLKCHLHEHFKTEHKTLMYVDPKSTFPYCLASNTNSYADFTPSFENRFSTQSLQSASELSGCFPLFDISLERR